MKTPHEKAVELLERFAAKQKNATRAKSAANACIDQLITHASAREEREYWEQVQTELQALPTYQPIY